MNIVVTNKRVKMGVNIRFFVHDGKIKAHGNTVVTKERIKLITYLVIIIE